VGAAKKRYAQLQSACNRSRHPPCDSVDPLVRQDSGTRSLPGCSLSLHACGEGLEFVQCLQLVAVVGVLFSLHLSFSAGRSFLFFLPLSILIAWERGEGGRTCARRNGQGERGGGDSPAQPQRQDSRRKRKRTRTKKERVYGHVTGVFLSI